MLELTTMLIVYSNAFNWKPRLISEMKRIGFNLYNESTATVPHRDDGSILNIHTLLFSDQPMAKSRYRYSPITGESLNIKVSIRCSAYPGSPEEHISIGIKASSLPSHNNRYMSLDSDAFNVASDVVEITRKLAIELRERA